MGHDNSKIRYWWRVKGVFLLQSCHRAAGCWRSPQKTPLHLVPRTKRWLDSHETSRSKADGQNCPIPVEAGQGLKGKKLFNNPSQRHLKVYSNTAHLIFTVFSTWQYEVIDRIPVHLQDKSVMSLPLERNRRKRGKTIWCQHNTYNFFLLLKWERALINPSTFSPKRPKKESKHKDEQDMLHRKQHLLLVLQTVKHLWNVSYRSN